MSFGKLEQGVVKYHTYKIMHTEYVVQAQHALGSLLSRFSDW